MKRLSCYLCFVLQLSVGLMLMFACDSEEMLPDVQKTVETNHNSVSVQRSRGEALEIAGSLFSQHDVRGSRKADFDVLCIRNKNKATRGGKKNAVDTLAYVLNRGESEGFVYISGDRRCEPVLAFSETGHISESDLIDNPGLKLFGLLHEAQILGYDEKTPVDSPDYGKKEPGEGVYSYKDYPDSVVYYQILGYSALLPRNLAWGQEDPYNMFAPIKNNKRCRAGCVPVACGQYLAYYRQPQQLQGKKIDWKAIHERGHIKQNVEIASLLRSIADGLNVSWGEKQTTVTSGRVPVFFESAGFQCDEYSLAYYVGIDSIVNRLVQGVDNRQLFLVQGADYKHSVGHMWIVDGSAQFVKVKRLKEKDGRFQDRAYYYWGTKNDKYLHMNWGWNGRNNGFFRAGIFRTDKFTELDDPFAWGGGRLSYFHDKRMNLSYDVGIWRFSPKK
jgi:peptidase C10 family